MSVVNNSLFTYTSGENTYPIDLKQLPQCTNNVAYGLSRILNDNNVTTPLLQVKYQASLIESLAKRIQERNDSSCRDCLVRVLRSALAVSILAIGVFSTAALLGNPIAAASVALGTFFAYTLVCFINRQFANRSDELPLTWLYGPFYPLMEMGDINNLKEELAKGSQSLNTQFAACVDIFRKNSLDTIKEKGQELIKDIEAEIAFWKETGESLPDATSLSSSDRINKIKGEYYSKDPEKQRAMAKIYEPLATVRLAALEQLPQLRDVAKKVTTPTDYLAFVTTVGDCQDRLVQAKREAEEEVAFWKSVPKTSSSSSSGSATSAHLEEVKKTYYTGSQKTKYHCELKKAEAERHLTNVKEALEAIDALAAYYTKGYEGTQNDG